ncbi:hypothetical protein BH09ACT10_BH09ACT10_00340 [soil metagenome]
MISMALGIYCAGLILAFGYRTFTHFGHTGRTGWVRIPRGDIASWVGATLFALALAIGLVALVLAAQGAVATVDVALLVGVAGLTLEAVALIGVIFAQESMGDSWRIGGNPLEKTPLVTKGLFGRVRNPIFSAMLASQVGIALVAPSVVSAAACLTMLVAIQISVRRSEEPYLRATHSAYRNYSATVGRFVPRVGLIR